MASTGYNLEESNADRNVEIWKIKKLIKSLEAARGNGTSMISLIIPPKDQISRVSKMLADEFGTASNIKSRVNRLSVLGAITSVQHRLKLYTKGATLEIITDKSQEGSQFVKGFGGIGGILRYRVDFQSLEVNDLVDDFDLDDL
ncbi:hypothetical protein HPB51_013988 [Rhipicephalus microplus]|uniref:Eukaryotic peptide chain release factor subunit 1 n=1 Tax=Rhipicephalus microplus TaxID=6941 RepID=A0A9J6DAD2_RHIMP|nr:hypothetical protein HPB51_013988 [Rhipicephalus microplus]